MKEKTIYDLKLHERMRLDGNLEVVRVPGGWLYFEAHYSKVWRLRFYKHSTTTFVLEPNDTSHCSQEHPLGLNGARGETFKAETGEG
jgi:hypothetical protein